MNMRIKQFCPKGHDTFIVGWTKQLKCKACVALYLTRYRKNNHDKVLTIGRRYEAANKDKIASQKLQHKYGITLAQKQEMFTMQTGKCAACSFVFASVSSAHVDHCHTSGKVRGLLCSSCNLVAGKAKDSPAILRSIADYLEQTV